MAKNILVVEDDFDTLYMLAKLLRLKGYDVETSPDADQALKVAQQRRPDLIITDIMMPGNSGLHLIQRVKGEEFTRAIPIIVISGCGVAVLLDSQSAGADFCIEKPIPVEALLEAIERLTETAKPGEQDKAPEESMDISRQLADELDLMVEQFRKASSREEKEILLKQIKERVFELQRKGATGRG